MKPRLALQAFAVCDRVSVERDRLLFEPVSAPLVVGELPVELGDEANLAVVLVVRRRRRLPAPLVLRLTDPAGEETTLYLREGKYGRGEHGLIVELAGYQLRRHGRYIAAFGYETAAALAEASFVVAASA